MNPDDQNDQTNATLPDPNQGANNMGALSYLMQGQQDQSSNSGSTPSPDSFVNPNMGTPGNLGIGPMTPLAAAAARFLQTSQANNTNNINTSNGGIATQRIGPAGTSILQTNSPGDRVAQMNNTIQTGLSGLATQYLQSQQQQNRAQFIQGIHQIMGTTASQQDKGNAINDLVNAHGTDYGMGWDKIALNMGIKNNVKSGSLAQGQIAQLMQTALNNPDQAHAQATSTFGPDYAKKYPQVASAIQTGANNSIMNVAENAMRTFYQDPTLQLDRATFAKTGQVQPLIPDQDKLAQQAQAQVNTVRGDQSLQKIETQRDASISAYNTLQNVASQNRLPSQLEYTDLLGQLIKSRTGAAPTNEMMSSLNTPTVKQGLNKLYTLVTGQTAPGNTQDVINNLKDFAKQTGMQADQLHDGYMKSRLVMPPGMDVNNWNAIASNARGLSFAQATANPPLSQGQPAQGNQGTNPSNQPKDFSSLWTAQPQQQQQTGQQ